MTINRLSKISRCVGMAMLTALLVSCNQNNELTEIPPCGKVEYEISYSNDLKISSIFGQFLPRKLSGQYNTEGVRLSLQAGLGMFKLQFVCASIDSYITIDFDGNKILLPLSQLINQAVNSPSDTNVTYSSETYDIAGWESKSMVFDLPTDDDSDPLHIEMFFVPTKNDINVKCDNEMVTLPGLMTGMNLSSGESNVMVLLRGIEVSDESEASIFARPDDHIQVTLSDAGELLLAMVDKFVSK